MLPSFPGLCWEQGVLRESTRSAWTLRPLWTPGSRGTGQEEHCFPGLQHPHPHPKQHRNTADATLDPATSLLHPAKYPQHCSTQAPTPPLQKPVQFCSRKSEVNSPRMYDLVGAGPIVTPSPSGWTSRYPPTLGGRIGFRGLGTLGLAVPAPPPAPAAASAAGWRMVFIPQRPAEHPDVGVRFAACLDRGDGSAVLPHRTQNEPFLEAPAGQGLRISPPGPGNGQFPPIPGPSVVPFGDVWGSGRGSDRSKLDLKRPSSFLIHAPPPPN